ncbi:two-component system response regulator [Thermotomaculum hydrothermale]|uniref:Phosphate regulon transcriptional regulatory protein PhoB n=1 Tax=Thermotomaculum hydrothermale TaxID=981385 RepID=A0A7R6PY88_9BACT|nr:response regulator transcription factor [Thermotomaculum hydrothermale]BBB33035.1 two-component system response regulator [Thermotomaculum hydrothermale]
MEKVKILICEDDKELLEIFNLILTMEGFEIDIAERGIDFKNMLEREKYSLILLDLGLPDIDGEHLCKFVCENYDIPVIVVSAKDNVATKVLCLEYGADDYIVKPFETVELVARIKSVLRRSKKRFLSENKEDLQKRIRWGELEINPLGRKVLKKGKEIALTPKEFDLILFFAKNRGKTFQREDIVETLWGEKSLYRWSRAIDVHINHLRKKIEDNPANPVYIQTIPGVGYRAKK